MGKRTGMCRPRSSRSVSSIHHSMSPLHDDVLTVSCSAYSVVLLSIQSLTKPPDVLLLLSFISFV